MNVLQLIFLLFLIYIKSIDCHWDWDRPHRRTHTYDSWESSESQEYPSQYNPSGGTNHFGPPSNANGQSGQYNDWNNGGTNHFGPPSNGNQQSGQYDNWNNGGTNHFGPPSNAGGNTNSHVGPPGIGQSGPSTNPNNNWNNGGTNHAGPPAIGQSGQLPNFTYTG